MIRRIITQWLAPRLIHPRWNWWRAAFDCGGIAPVACEGWGWPDIIKVLEPDFVVGGEDNPYLLRWWLLPRNRWFNCYLHLFLRSDDDRALHDHEYVNLSVLLAGAYTEHTVKAGGVNLRTRREAGDLKLRRPSSAHRIELTDGPCWTLFITGPRVRKWGFHCPNGWVDWEVFTKPGAPGEVGVGCGGQGQ